MKTDPASFLLDESADVVIDKWQKERGMIVQSLNGAIAGDASLVNDKRPRRKALIRNIRCAVLVCGLTCHGGWAADQGPVSPVRTAAEGRDVIESYKLGVNSYIQKPVDFTSFSSMVGQLGLYWLVVNQVPPVNGVNHQTAEPAAAAGRR